MTVNTSSIPAAIAYLVTAAKTAFAPTVLVCDGPMVEVDQESYAERVTIGWDGNEETLNPAVDGSQDFNALNRAVGRNEDYSIACSVSHWDGNGDNATARTAAFALLATFERLLRGVGTSGSGDTTLGGAVLFSRIAGGIQVLPQPAANGTFCTVVFHVTCRARLTGS